MEECMASKAEVIDADNILIINNPANNNNKDLVIVYGLAPADVIIVYSDKDGRNELGRDVVAANESQVVITGITLPTTSGGTVYITRGEADAQSDKTAKAYAVE
jgi:hypothetical protein